MKQYKNIIVFLCLVSPLFTLSNTWAQATADEILAEDDVRALETEWENSNERFKQLEVTQGELQKQQIIMVRDKETGLLEGKDAAASKKRFAIGQHFHSNARRVFDIKMLDFNFGYNFKEHLWVETFVSTMNAKFGSISQPNTTRGLNEEVLNDTNETMLNVGLGLGLTTTFLRDFLKFDNLFETYSAFLAVGRLSEDFMSETYQGPGLRADWGVHWRMAQYLHLGLKFSWSHYSLKRGELFQDEPQSPRHLSISWLSLGIEGAIYF